MELFFLQWETYSKENAIFFMDIKNSTNFEVVKFRVAHSRSIG